MKNARPIDIQLRMAVSAGQKDMVERCLDDGADVNSRASDGVTPLMQAVLCGHFEVADLLLMRGASIDARDSAHWTALMRVAYMGLDASVLYLIERGADTEWEDDNQQTALTLAQWGGAESVVGLLLKSTDLRRAWQDAVARRRAEEIACNKARALQRLRESRPKSDPFGRKKG